MQILSFNSNKLSNREHCDECSREIEDCECDDEKDEEHDDPKDVDENYNHWSEDMPAGMSDFIYL